MKPTSFSLKTVVAILGLLLLQTSLFAWAVKPIPGIGIVVKKNPGSTAEKKAITDEEGNFQMKLTRGSYQLSLPEQQISSAINAINESARTLTSNGQGTDHVTCALMETEGIKIWNSESIDGNVSAIIEVTAAEATIIGALYYERDAPPKETKKNGQPSIIKMIDGKATQLVAAPTGTNGNMEATDMAINEKGLPGTKTSTNKKENAARTTAPAGSNESMDATDMAINEKGLPGTKTSTNKKQNAARTTAPVSTDKNYVGHVSLIKREINPESGGQPNMETFTPTNKLPGKNQKIIFYEIKTISMPGYGNTQSGNMAVAYQFFTANGKTYAVPSLLFDLPNPPSDIQFQVAEFSSSASRMAKPTSSGSEISFNPSTQQCDLSYQASVGGKTAMVQMSLTEIETTMSNNPTQSSYWCGVSTKCGAVFAVLVTNGTPCGSVNGFFNKVCDGLKASQE
jgi:hypothetical protein